MRIVLLENIPKLTNDEIKSWNEPGTTNTEEAQAIQDNLVDTVIKRFNNDKLLNLAPSLFHSFEVYSPNPLSNPFYKFLDALGKTSLDFNKQEKINEFLISLIDINNKEHISLDNKYFLLPSLYERKNLREFNYTVRLLDMVNNPYKLKQRIKDTSMVKVNQLFVDNNIKNDLKPVGEGEKSTDTLYGVVLSWSGKDGQNEKDSQESSKKVKVKVNLKTLQNIMNKYQYATLKELIKEHPELNKEGKIIYARALSHKSNNVKLSDMDSQSFYIFNNGKWVKYENELTAKLLK